ncbi:hypothetical protein Ade02nite_81730 [Paractinoplanes deccanensis]|uniref:DUF3592 domain-containing protein n=1 Tax=Paractinoplanes deccanensis TaxID=113561 RepID=A0ABQ3YHS3_9ACTN|nr:hypothetical protein [Actinoplanes deccanensis]GID79532.1 hypothetical protein Ade02nite_81730 [Actinoplanes deccanensis]
MSSGDPSHPASRGKVTLYATAGVLVVAGLALLIGGLVVTRRDAAHADRLQREGTATNAVLLDYQDASLVGSAQALLRYWIGDQQHESRIACSDAKDCDPATHPALQIKYDPAHPEQFVTDDGITDRSANFFNSTRVVVAGAVLILLGLVVAYFPWRTQRRVSRAAAGRVWPPRRETEDA